MKIAEKVSPDKTLQPYIKAYYFVEAGLHQTRHILPPMAKHYMLFHYGDDFYVDFIGGKKILATGSRLMGCHTEPISMGGVDALAKFTLVELQPLVVRHLIKDNAQIITDTVIWLSDIFGETFVSQLREGLGVAKNRNRQVAHLNAMFLEYFHSFEAPANPITTALLSNIHRNNARLNLENFAAQSGYTQRHIREVFKTQIGISPKKYARIWKNERLLRELYQNRIQNYCDLALKYDYYDQTHFIKEIKRTTWKAPTQFNQNKQFDLFSQIFCSL